MSEFKGTKGKWIADIQHHKVYKEDGNILCVLYHTNNVNKEESPINAQLISKAPELLDFINRISGEMLRNDFVLDEKWHDQAQELIKKATEI